MFLHLQRDVHITANARLLGGTQADAQKKVSATLGVGSNTGVTVSGSATGAMYIAEPNFPNILGSITGSGRTLHFDSSRVVRTSSEVRPANVAMHPTIRL